MPSMPAMLISINTTSGLSFGKCCKAASAFPYTLTQRNPGELFKKAAMDWHSLFSSSTIDMEIMGSPLLLHCSGEGKNKADRRPLADLGLQEKIPPHFRQAAAHVPEAITEPGG